MEHAADDLVAQAVQPGASLSDWEQQHRRAEQQEGEGAGEEEGQAHAAEERSRLAAERDMASLYAHAGLGANGTDFNTALHAMDEHSQLLADFAMSAQEGGASREGFYEPGNPMHEAFSHQHQHQHEQQTQHNAVDASEAERSAHEIAARMLEDASGEPGRVHETLGSGASTSRTKERSVTAPTKATRGRKADGNPLTPAQKKVNHIVSEQRRRASIRRGYELLCQDIPALRMAPLVGGALRGGSGPGGGGAVGGRKRERDALLGIKSPVVKRRRGNKHLEYAVDGTSASYSVGASGQPDEGLGQTVKRPTVELSAIGLDGRSGPRSENNVLTKTVEYIRSQHFIRLQLLERLQALRQAAQSRFSPSQHEDLLLRPQTVAAIVVVEPRLPTLQEFLKQHNAKVAAGQFVGRPKRKKGDKAADKEQAGEVTQLEEPAAADAAADVDTELAPNESETTEAAEEIKAPEAQLQTVLVDWEDVWKGGQIIDDEEEADNAANTA